MAGTIDTAIERKRDEEARHMGVKPERAPGKKAPDTRGPLADDEPSEEEDDGRGRD